MLELLELLVQGHALTADQARDAFEKIMTGTVPDVEIAAFLTALRVRGETVDELYGAASVMRQKVVPWGDPIPGLLDTCGTGGDNSMTFNISTATAIVAAACGVPIAKHGNRSLSSPSGSAEVLHALGVNIELPTAEVRQCICEVGLGFFFAPHWHPAMRHVMPVRRQLRFRTIFNLLGPLSNPASAEFQLLGVGRPEWTRKLAQTLALLGTRSATVVTGSDGLDEVTLDGTTTAACIRDGHVEVLHWTHEDFGLPRSVCSDWKVTSPEDSARIIVEILEGQKGPCRDIVLANTAAALWTAKKVDTLREGVQMATEAIDAGKAREKLRQLVEYTQRKKAE